eukprot:gene4223-5999_t
MIDIILSFACIGITSFIRKYRSLVNKPRLVYSSTSTYSHILSKCPSLNQSFYPTLIFNPHLQFIPFVIKGIIDKYILPPFQYISEKIKMKDGETLVLDWVVSNCNNNQGTVSTGLQDSEHDDTPIVMLQHGAMCDSRDLPGQDYILSGITRGWIVCCLNRRGHSGPLTQPKWNFFGSYEDLHEITQYILSKRPKARLLTIGISSGSGLVARHFGNHNNHDFIAGVGICPGYDIEKCMKKFSSPYSDLLLQRGKDFFLLQNKELLEGLKGYEECLNANNLQDWLDHSYAMAGCKSKEDYYLRYNPMNHCKNITKPCLFINAEDDPICVVDNVMENIELFNESNGAMLALTKTGSHCPFYEGFFMNNWAEKAAYEFFDAVLLSHSRQ